MQIAELMHENVKNPEGLLVANDIDNTRCYLLVHQTLKRLPTANCVVVNHDAANMPAPLDKDGKVRLFDRVLCDVICSGDGTFRKNPDLWSRWDPSKGLGLHKLQVNIASRCLELLEVGGLMCYSTCSLNPIEDEAVLGSLLRTFKGAIELVDVSDKMPALKRSPGMSTWKVRLKLL
jgi:16S rRNA C967 or C1407 C5-methylase (RsmB/RsmF family)